MKRLYVLYSLDLFVLALYLPVFGPYLKSLGATHFDIGVVNSISALISLIWTPIIGSLSDLKGRRSLLVKSAAAGVIGSCLMGLSSTVTLIFVGKIIGAFASPVTTLLKTITTDLSKTTEERNKIFHKSKIISCVFFVFGAILSGFISEKKDGNSIVFYLIGLSFILQIILAYWLPDDTKPQKPHSDLPLWATATKEIKSAINNMQNVEWPIYWDLFISKGAIDLSYGILAANIGLLLVNDYSMNGLQRGYFFTMLSVFTIIGIIIKSKHTKNNVDESKILQGSAILFLCYLTLGVFSSIYTFLASVALLTIVKAYLDTFFTELITSRTKEDERGKVISTFDNLYPMSLFVSPLISGYIADVFGERLTISLGAIPCAMSFVVTFFWRKSKRKSQ